MQSDFDFDNLILAWGFNEEKRKNFLENCRIKEFRFIPLKNMINLNLKEQIFSQLGYIYSKKDECPLAYLGKKDNQGYYLKFLNIQKGFKEDYHSELADICNNSGL